MLRSAAVGGLCGVALTLLLTYGAAAISGGGTEEITNAVGYMGVPLVILGVVVGALVGARRQGRR